jgi:ubiquinone/menaquinone biosynthesis C-methylase UbiE
MFASCMERIAPLTDKEGARSTAEKDKDIRLYEAIAEDLGKPFAAGSSIVLDFGCGDGQLVRRLRELGFEAYGTDILLKEQDDTLRLIRNGNQYRFPFADRMFDAIISCSVLEHVKNLSEAVAEMHRVLKPGGFCLHFFPPKLRPIEAHTFVPFAGVFQSYAWLLFWSLIGVRNSFGKTRTFVKNAQHNYEFLHKKTAYQSRRELREHMSQYFDRVLFVERHHVKHSYGRVRAIHPIVHIVPQLASLYSAFHLTVLFCDSPIKSLDEGQFPS